MPALALLLLSVLPHNAACVQRFERAERNNVYDDCGRLVFTQLIWFNEAGRVEGWRMDKGQFEIRREGKHTVCRFEDQGVSREVWVRSFEETWDQHDKEVADREVWPVIYRRDLRKP